MGLQTETFMKNLKRLFKFWRNFKNAILPYRCFGTSGTMTTTWSLRRTTAISSLARGSWWPTRMSNTREHTNVSLDQLQWPRSTSTSSMVIFTFLKVAVRWLKSSLFCFDSEFLSAAAHAIEIWYSSTKLDQYGSKCTEKYTSGTAKRFQKGLKRTK